VIQIAKLSHCRLYSTVLETYFDKPVTYTVQSNDGTKAFIITRVSFLGDKVNFIVNGKGDGFPTPIEAANHINKIIQKGVSEECHESNQR
jgi:hypothetical protein